MKNGKKFYKKLANNLNHKMKALFVQLKVKYNHKSYFMLNLKSLGKFFQCLIKVQLIVIGIGKIRILHMLKVDTNNNLDIQVHIVWMLQQWLYILFGILNHLNNVQYRMQIMVETVIQQGLLQVKYVVLFMEQIQE